MRCRSTKEAGELVERVMPELCCRVGNSKLDHAAIRMVRSRWWETVPKADHRRGLILRFDGKPTMIWHANEYSGEIPWR